MSVTVCFLAGHSSHLLSLQRHMRHDISVVCSSAPAGWAACRPARRAGIVVDSPQPQLDLMSLHPQVDVAMQLLATLPSWSQARPCYEKGSVLGSGTFARVYAAQVTETNTPVALKQMSLRKAGTKHRRAADEQRHGDPVDAAREVLVLQALQSPHPHVVQTHSVYYDDESARLVIAAESCRGSLKQHLDSCVGIQTLDAVQLFSSRLLHGLAHCHAPTP